MIRFFCNECGNDNEEGYALYTEKGDLCDILLIVCKQCGNTREILVSGQFQSFSKNKWGK